MGSRKELLRVKREHKKIKKASRLQDEIDAILNSTPDTPYKLKPKHTCWKLMIRGSICPICGETR